MNSLASADILVLLGVKEGFVFQLGNGVGRMWFVKVSLRAVFDRQHLHLQWLLLHLSAVSAHKRGQWVILYCIDPLASSPCSLKQKEL